MRHSKIAEKLWRLQTSWNDQIKEIFPTIIAWICTDQIQLHCFTVVTIHYVSACGIRPKTQFWLFQHFRHSEGALGCKTKVPSWIFDFHQFSGAHWGGWSEPIRDLFVTFLKMCAISIISVWRPNMVSLWSFIVSTSPSVNNFSYLWQNIQILSQTLTKT